MDPASRPEEPFLNDPIETDGLPTVPADRFEPLDPRYLQIRLTGDAIAAGVVLVVTASVAAALPGDGSIPGWLPLLVGGVVMALIALVAACFITETMKKDSN